MTTIRLHPSGKEVDCAPGDTVLGALEKSGYALPNNCRAGACGECKCHVREGEFDQGMVLDMALSQEDREKGFGLMCMAKPLSDVLEIDFGTADAQPKLFPPRENVMHVVTDRIDRTPRIIELRLRPLAEPLRFWPGQYVQLGDDFSGIPPRCYSIANAPRPDGEITLQITKVDGGVTSQWVHDKIFPGDRIKISGPYGTFIGDPSVETPVLCLAAGSGLAPILSLTEAALRRSYKGRVTLLVSARTQADLYDEGLMTFYRTRYRNFRYRTTMTREEGPDLSGRVPEVLPTLFPDLSKHSVFIAGSPGFVDACKSAAKTLGAKDELIHTEGFVGQALPDTPEAERLVSLG